MRQLAWLLLALLPLGCASTRTQVVAEPPEQPPAVKCAGAVAVGILFAPLLAYEVVTLAAVTPIALLINKDKTVESWRAIGRPGCP